MTALLRIFNPRRKPGRASLRAATLLGWSKERRLESPLACAFFLASKALGWNRRKIAEEFGRSRATVQRWLPRGEAIVLEALRDEQLRGHDLRELMERLHGS